MKFSITGNPHKMTYWSQVSVNTLEFFLFFRRDGVTTGSFALYGKYLWQGGREYSASLYWEQYNEFINEFITICYVLNKNWH